MDIRKNRLIKQCEIILGEDFDQDFIYEGIDFSSPTKIWEAYLEYVILNEKQIAGLVKKSEKSGISYGILKKVYDRGMAAWKTGHRPGTTPQQWAFARVNSFITGGKTRTTADADLWAKHKGKKEDIDEAKKVIAQVELWNGKKMKKSFKNQSAAEKFIKKMQDQEDVRGYNMYAESTAEYAKSLEKIANDRKLKNISKKDKEILKKIAALMSKANEGLEEAMKFWKVTITKKAGKLFKGQNVVIKARNSAEAIKKGIKQMKGNPALVPGGSVTAELDESNGK